MRRAIPAALLAGLVLAGPAAAAPPLPPPFVHGTVVGGESPIRMLAQVTPPVHLFGDEVTATVNVLADRKWIDPARLRLQVRFFPYQAVALPVKHESVRGRLIYLTWRWKLRCLAAKCVPIVPPSDTEHIFHFRNARIDYVDAKGKVEWSDTARFPAVEVFSRITPAMAAYVIANHKIKWQWELAPPAVSRRASPGLIFWLALVLAALCATAAVVVAARWVLRLRSPVAVSAGPASSSLERALALFFWAGRSGDETLQRKALERVAAELPLDVADLSDVTRELAWSPAIPEEDKVEAISERAGVPAHHENGAGE